LLLASVRFIAVACPLAMMPIGVSLTILADGKFSGWHKARIMALESWLWNITIGMDYWLTLLKSKLNFVV